MNRRELATGALAVLGFSLTTPEPASGQSGVTCKTCKFFALGSGTVARVRTGECRRFPPTFSGGLCQYAAVNTGTPACGEYRLAPGS